MYNNKLKFAKKERIYIGILVIGLIIMFNFKFFNFMYILNHIFEVLSIIKIALNVIYFNYKKYFVELFFIHKKGAGELTPTPYRIQ